MMPNMVQALAGDFQELGKSSRAVKERFETEFARIVDAKKASATQTGRAAFAFATQLLGLKAGDEVVIPSLACGAVPDSLVSVGLVPILADVKASDGTVDPSKLRECLSPKTKAIVPIHYQGIPCDMAEIIEVATKRNLFVIEDCAHAVGSKYANRLVGTLGEFAFFSFSFDKPFTTGGGGMLTSGSREFAGRLMESEQGLGSPSRLEELQTLRLLWETKLLRNRESYGIASMSFLLVKGIVSTVVPRPRVKLAPMNDVAAAVGLKQTRIMKWSIKKRIQNCMLLDRIVEQTDDLFGTKSPEKTPVRLRYTIFGQTEAMRDNIMRELKRRGIEAGPIDWRMPLHRSSYYSELTKRRTRYTGTDKFCNTFLNIPCHPYLSPLQFEKIEDVLLHKGS